MSFSDDSSSTSTPEDRLVENYIDLCVNDAVPDLEIYLSKIEDSGLCDRVRERILVYEGQVKQLAGGREDSDLHREVPRAFGDFVIERELGRGGMGIVYEARQLSLDRTVALKVLPRLAAFDRRRVNRFLREGNAMAALQHPGIVPVYVCGEDHDVLFFVMERVVGLSLAQISRSLADARPEDRRVEMIQSLLEQNSGDETSEEFLLPSGYVAFCAELVARVADALQYAHERGVVHRDVKPSNLMIMTTGEPRLIDFGLARLNTEKDPSMTRSEDRVGTPTYMPPEEVSQQGGDAGVSGDIYSLGVVLFELLAGRPPFEGESSAEVMHKIQRLPTPMLRTFYRKIPRDLETICHKALEKNPERRFESARAFSQDLRRFLSFRPIQARRPHLIPRSLLWVRRNRLASSVMCVLVLVLIGSLLVRSISNRRTEKMMTDLEGSVELAIADGALDRAGNLLNRLVAFREDHPRRTELESRLSLGRSNALLLQARRMASDLEGNRKDFLTHEATRRSLEAGSTTQHVDEKSYGEVVRLDLLCEELGVRSRQGFVELYDLLQDAENLARQAGRSDYPPVRSAMANMFFLEWQHAKATRVDRWAQVTSDLVREYDDNGELSRILDALTRVHVLAPPGLEVFLFRYEPRHRVKANDWTKRPVPVPFDPEKRESLFEPRDGFLPGDPCLQVRRTDALVDPPRWHAGDIIVAIDGMACGEGFRVLSVEKGSLGEESGVLPFDRLVSVEGEPVQCWFDIRYPFYSNPAKPLRVVFEGAGGKRTFLVQGPEFVGVSGIFLDQEERCLKGQSSPRDMILTVLSDGIKRDVELGSGDPIDLDVVATTYPLMHLQENLWGRTPVLPRNLAPGEYLIVLRDNQRVVARNFFRLDGESEATFDIEVSGFEPDGDVVWVPGGKLTRGLDPTVDLGKSRETVDVAGFWIDRYEVSVGEWEEFLADPKIGAFISDHNEKSGEWIYVPRRSSTRRKLSSSPMKARFGARSISFNDISAYLQWANRRLEEAGEPYRCVLPSEAEYMRAAGFVDERWFSWGREFEPALTHCFTHHQIVVVHTLGDHLGDESPFLVRDLGGNLAEWCRDEFRQGQYLVKGGATAYVASDAFRTEAISSYGVDSVESFVGFRRVYRSVEWLLEEEKGHHGGG